VRFWPTVAGNGQLFHVEQFEIGSNDAGFRSLFAVKNTVGGCIFTVPGAVFYGEIFAVTVRREELDTSLLVAGDDADS